MNQIFELNICSQKRFQSKVPGTVQRTHNTRRSDWRFSKGRCIPIRLRQLHQSNRLDFDLPREKLDQTRGTRAGHKMGTTVRES